MSVSDVVVQGHFVKECLSPMTDLNSQWGKEERQYPPLQQKRSDYIYYGPEPRRRDCIVHGWARTGLEPEVEVGK